MQTFGKINYLNPIGLLKFSNIPKISGFRRGYVADSIANSHMPKRAAISGSLDDVRRTHHDRVQNYFTAHQTLQIVDGSIRTKRFKCDSLDEPLSFHFRIYGESDLLARAWSGEDDNKIPEIAQEALSKMPYHKIASVLKSECMDPLKTDIFLESIDISKQREIVIHLPLQRIIGFINKNDTHADDNLYVLYMLPGETRHIVIPQIDTEIATNILEAINWAMRLYQIYAQKSNSNDSYKGSIYKPGRDFSILKQIYIQIFNDLRSRVP